MPITLIKKVQDGPASPSRAHPEPSSLAVIGAGFGRTGTLSLKLALQRLGLGRVYHMESVFGHPWHARRWRAAYRRRKSSAVQPFAWPLCGYRAAIDWPACAFYAPLAQHYPQAKVILTVRDPNSWYESAERTIYAVMRGFPFNRLGRSLPLLADLGTMLDEIIWQGTFNGRFTDRLYAIETFERHNAAVIANLPPNRLLVFDVRQGWEPLCAFLDRPIPAEPFPHANDAASYRRRVWLLTLGLNRLHQ